MRLDPPLELNSKQLENSKISWRLLALVCRSIVHDARLDPVLENAAINAGITDIAQRLPRAVMWINPGEVKFTQYAVGELSEQKSIVYSTEKAHSTPKEWDAAYYENHKPFMVDQSEVGGGWTPPAGSGPSKEAVARFELARAVRNSQKQVCARVCWFVCVS